MTTATRTCIIVIALTFGMTAAALNAQSPTSPFDKELGDSLGDLDDRRRQDVAANTSALFGLLEPLANSVNSSGLGLLKGFNIRFGTAIDAKDGSNAYQVLEYEYARSVGSWDFVIPSTYFSVDLRSKGRLLAMEKPTASNYLNSSLSVSLTSFNLFNSASVRTRIRDELGRQVKALEKEAATREEFIDKLMTKGETTELSPQEQKELAEAQNAQRELLSRIAGFYDDITEKHKDLIRNTAGFAYYFTLSAHAGVESNQRFTRKQVKFDVAADISLAYWSSDGWGAFNIADWPFFLTRLLFSPVSGSASGPYLRERLTGRLSPYFPTIHFAASYVTSDAIDRSPDIRGSHWRVGVEVTFRTVMAEIDGYPVYFNAYWNWTQVLSPSKQLRRSNLDSSSYYRVELEFPVIQGFSNGITFTYSNGRLPLDDKSSQEVRLGFRVSY